MTLRSKLSFYPTDAATMIEIFSITTISSSDHLSMTTRQQQIIIRLVEPHIMLIMMLETPDPTQKIFNKMSI